MLKPQRLNYGDRVGVIAPAGPPIEKDLRKGLVVLRSLGLDPVLGAHVLSQGHAFSYLAAPDEARLEDLHRMFLDPCIKAVFCARGGYGTARLAPYVDYSIIRCNPKVFWGYSDITYLHTAIHKCSSLVTFHGPMVASDLGKNSVNNETTVSLSQLFIPKNTIYRYPDFSFKSIQNGKAEGILVGGNLTVLADSLGTDFELNTDNRILFIEEINEPAYRIDAMLMHLKLAGKFERVKGVILGDFNLEASEFVETQLLLRQFFAPYNIPVLQGFPAGHCTPNYGIPIGGRVYLDTISLVVEFETGVT
ncbi:S66 peptidase family protein [Halobacillus halophilus]|uniref:S66 peptidase family protein n=1 Tax=Halobacillus halophilus TaxID=1570 RepID=UPI001CD71322|nr:LD-carboxypeptidase [Halobacillus halophilus]MCA1009197.1 LD-carboxypeptidase [Halobacillus halophilus]